MLDLTQTYAHLLDLTPDTDHCSLLDLIQTAAHLLDLTQTNSHLLGLTQTAAHLLDLTQTNAQLLGLTETAAHLLDLTQTVTPTAMRMSEVTTPISAPSSGVTGVPDSGGASADRGQSVTATAAAVQSATAAPSHTVVEMIQVIKDESDAMRHLTGATDDLTQYLMRVSDFRR